MVEVAEPLWVMHNEQRVLIADAGYSWLQIFPEGTNYTHTTMFDPEGQPVQEYIDIVAEHGVGDDGIPWYDDLYLDITWIPEGSPLLLDQEELEAAHAIGAITQEHYDLARGETARLLVALALGDYTLPEIARALLSHAAGRAGRGRTPLLRQPQQLQTTRQRALRRLKILYHS